MRVLVGKCHFWCSHSTLSCALGGLVCSRAVFWSIESMKMPCSQSELIKRERDLSLKLAWRANLFSFLRCYAPVWHFHYNKSAPPCKFVLRGRIKRKCARTSKKCFICQWRAGENIARIKGAVGYSDMLSHERNPRQNFLGSWTIPPLTRRKHLIASRLRLLFWSAGEILYIVNSNWAQAISPLRCCGPRRRSLPGWNRWCTWGTQGAIRW